MKLYLRAIALNLRDAAGADCNDVSLVEILYWLYRPQLLTAGSCERVRSMLARLPPSLVAAAREMINSKLKEASS